jgi:hypothetical protein
MQVEYETLISVPLFAMIAMTVYRNRGRTSKGTDLLSDWDISDSELLSALSDEDQQKLVRDHNELADTHTHVSHVANVTELEQTEAPVRDMIEQDLERSLCDVALGALDNREATYIVGVEKTSMANFYTVSVLTE